MGRVLARSSHLTGSEGSEYDVITEEQSLTNQEEKIAAKLGLHPRLMGVDAADLITAEDLAPVVPSPMPKNASSKVSVEETLGQGEGLSRREMNRAKRKVCNFLSSVEY